MDQQLWYQMNNDIDYAALAARNSKVACETVNTTRNELLDRMSNLESVVASQAQKISQLQQQYFLLMSKNFNGGSTDVN